MVKNSYMNKELRESRGIMAVITIDDIEKYLWEEQIQQLSKLLEVIEDGRKSDGKKKSKLLVYDETKRKDR